ncbi:MAG: GAF domain-containing sensor histidine kinase [Polyangiaceae bacterium]
MERRSSRPGGESSPTTTNDESRAPRGSGQQRSALARSLQQHRAFLELSRVVAAGEQGVWTGALPLVLAPAGATWGAVYRSTGATLEIAASEGVPLALRAQLATFDFARHTAFAGCRAARSRRVVADERLFSGTLPTRTREALEAAGIASGVAVPIAHAGAVLGVLVVGASAKDPIDQDAVLFLDAIASFVAPAVAVSESSRHPAAERSGPSSRVSAPPTLPSSAPPPPKRSTDAARAVLDALQQAAPVLRRLGTDVRVANDDDCFIACEPGDLRLAIAHLIVNAAEAAAERAPLAGAPTTPRRVRVSVVREGSLVTVSVDDSGRGVPHDLRARVFEPGFSTRGKGRGDGLSVVRQFAGEHAGHVEIASSEMGGASFRLVLPGTSTRPEAAGPSRHTSATWPQLRIPGRSRESRPAAAGAESEDEDPDRVAGTVRAAG